MIYASLPRCLLWYLSFLCCTSHTSAAESTDSALQLTTAEQQYKFEQAPIGACPGGLTSPCVLMTYLWSSVCGSSVLSDNLLSCHDCISAFIHTRKGGGAAKVA